MEVLLDAGNHYLTVRHHLAALLYPNALRSQVQCAYCVQRHIVIINLQRGLEDNKRLEQIRSANVAKVIYTSGAS